ncbi:hypothetical protein FRC10_002087 [Ceratobasidium sp. 414]|nr:hypothetical protein FRC10_002087 [Ceratobasidium sp. 414]
MPRTFWGYPAADAVLAATADSYDYPFARRGGAGLYMAFRIFEGLEVFGPLRVMSGQINDEDGIVFVLGRDNDSVDSIPSELRAPLEQMYGHPPRLFTQKEDTPEMGIFTAPRVGGDDGEVDVLWRGGELKIRLSKGTL